LSIASVILKRLNVSGIPEGVILNSLSWWFVFIMMAMNIAVFGGIIGEVVKKRTYGRSSLMAIKNQHLHHRSKGHLV